MKNIVNRATKVIGISFVLISLLWLGCATDDSSSVETHDQFLDCKLFESVCDSLVLEFQQREVDLCDSTFYYGILAYNTISMQDHVLKGEPFGTLDGLVKNRLNFESIQNSNVEISSGMGLYFRNWNIVMGGGPGLPKNSFWTLVRCE